MIDDEG